MRDKIKELIKSVEQLEKLMRRIISLIGWILILIKLLTERHGAQAPPLSKVYQSPFNLSIYEKRNISTDKAFYFSGRIGLRTDLVDLQTVLNRTQHFENSIPTPKEIQRWRNLHYAGQISDIQRIEVTQGYR